MTTEDIQEEKQIEKIEENQELEETKPAEASENIQVEEEVKAEKPPISLRKIDRNALTVVKKLRAAGFEALLTGGCVRDLLLGMSPKDFDVATSAKPDEVKKLFKNCRLVGRRFLLAHVCFPGRKVIETSTFRKNPTEQVAEIQEPQEAEEQQAQQEKIDSEASQENQESQEKKDLLVKDDNVYGNVEEDALRRDLTINGLFYDPIEGKVLDYADGLKDLEAKVIKTIGDPNVRFREDPVRMIRAIKFATRMEFEIEAETKAAIKSHAGDIAKCAPSRLQEEILKLMTSGHAKEAILMFRELGLLDELLPELGNILNGELTQELPAVEAKPEEEAEGAEAEEINEEEIQEEEKENETEEKTEEASNSAEPAKVSLEVIEETLSDEEREALVARWNGLLGALDEVKARKVGLSPTVAFATMLLPAYRALEKSQQNERQWIDRLCVNWAQKIRFTRHDQDRIRILLSAVDLFSAEKLEDKSSQYLVRKPWFREALLLFIIQSVANKENLELVEEWKKLAKKAGKYFIQEKYVHRKANFGFRRNRFSRGRNNNFSRRRS